MGSANEIETRYRMYRLLAFSSMVYSVVAVVCVCLALPMAQQHVTHATHKLKHQVTTCLTTASHVGHQLRSLKSAHVEIAMNAQNRTKRQNGYGVPTSFVETPGVSTQCAGCCLPGPPGPAGNKGESGLPGRNGAHGLPGFPGRLPKPTCEDVTSPPCDCEQGAPGPPGPDGRPGPVGNPGYPGRQGSPGAAGRSGPKGAPGSYGQPGSDGAPGDPGADAASYIVPGERGPDGFPGPAGLAGVPGTPGQNQPAGSPGPKGPSGPPGPPGPIGPSGPNGEQGGAGSPGEPGICPKYCAIDGGVFFVDGTIRRH